jgi:glycosyltransferase involved in cell wall biosynthesis
MAAFSQKSLVLFVARWPVGGIRTYIRDLAASSALRDYEFALVAPNEAGLDEFLAEGHLARVRWIPVPPSSRSMVNAAIDACHELKPRFIHSHGFTSGAIGALASRAVRLPHLLTVHDLLFNAQFRGLRGRARRLSLAASLVMTDTIHCVTQDSRENLLESFPLLTGLESKTVVISHGVDVDRILAAPACDIADRIAAEPGCVTFGFLGRFMAQKGFRVLTDAIGILKNQGFTPARARVLAVGSGGFIREDRARLARFGLEEFFIFWPYQSDVAATLKGINCLVMPSLWEASGLLAMEAMVAGIPVIGSDCLGLRETLADTPAIRVPPNNALQLSQALEAFIAQPPVSAARQFKAEAARRFAAGRAFARLNDLYATIS